MKRLFCLAALSTFVLGLALSHPALAKNEKGKSNNRVEKFLVCHVTKTEPTENPEVEMASGHYLAVTAAAAEAHERHGDLVVEGGEAGEDCEFARDVEVKEKNPNHAGGRNRGDESDEG